MTSQLIKKPSQILSDMLRTYKAARINQGVATPQVDPGSDAYLRFQSFANELAIASQNVVIADDNRMADTATGTNLDRICNSYGLTRRPAGKASGIVAIVTSIPTVVATGTQLISNLGLVYEVTIGGTYSSTTPGVTDQVPVTSKDTGFDTNLGVGVVMAWLATPAYAQSTATVAVEIAGGIDAEDDDTLRARLFALLRNPPLYGNWQSVANLAENSSAAVQKAFVYPAANGPATQHLALVGYTTAGGLAIDGYGKNRDIADLSGISSYILGNLPEHTDTVITSVGNVQTDVAFAINIPFPEGAINNGIGGGWLDFEPFPAPNVVGADHDGITLFSFCSVETVTDTTHIVIAAPDDLSVTAGTTRISWINRFNNWTVETATVIAVATGSGSYTVTLDRPFSAVAVGDFIFPASVNQQAYVDQVLTKMALLGPGEKTNVTTLLPRALRKPIPSLGWNNVINSTSVSKTLVDNNPEVTECTFFARREFSGDEFGSAAPDLPAVISGPPNIYVPFNLGFYPSIE